MFSPLLVRLADISTGRIKTLIFEIKDNPLRLIYGDFFQTSKNFGCGSC